MSSDMSHFPILPPTFNILSWSKNGSNFMISSWWTIVANDLVSFFNSGSPVANSTDLFSFGQFFSSCHKNEGP